MEIYALARELAAKLKASDIYTEYLDAYKALSSDELAKITAFKQAAAQHGDLSFEEEKRMSNIYVSLTLNTAINAFLDKERVLCKTLAEVCAIVSDLQIDTFS